MSLYFSLSVRPCISSALDLLISTDVAMQVATDALVQMEKAMARDKIETNDRQLACARIMSTEGQNYLQAMAAAANYAWVNRTSMMFLTRQVQCE